MAFSRVASCAVVLIVCTANVLRATPATVEHAPSSAVYGEAAGTTQREPERPREAEAVDAWIKIGPSFSYDSVAVYYTTDGSEPIGSRGVVSGTARVLRSYAVEDPQAVFFVRNEPGQNGNDDWWRADFPYSAPTNAYGTRIRYRISAWQAGDPSSERFAGGGTVYEWTNTLAWPGAGFGSPNPAEGYPPYHVWKEEAVVGNNFINVMLDQNGSVYDIYYPSVGCVQGVGTANEGYDDGNRDEFPSCLSPGQRGQMNMNIAMLGLRVDGLTYWLSNQTGTAYSGVSQSYLGDTNIVRTTGTLTANGHNIGVEQIDFAPRGYVFPNDDGGQPNRGVYFKRVILTNNQALAATVNLYYYADWALNGGDGFDGSFTDPTRGAMVAYDNTFRTATSSNGCIGEYNPTTFATYDKDVSVYLAMSMKVAPAVGVSGGTFAGDFWADTSADQDRGWVGAQVVIPAGGSVQIDIATIGGFDAFAGATGTYAYYIDTALSGWFYSIGTHIFQLATTNSWQAWLNAGVGFDCPDAGYNELFKRGLLATALHLDGQNGGIIAGMHNGAYPFVWPRDAAWAAITLARTGHVAEAKEIFRFLRDIAYRDTEGWGRKGFWKQKYTTDGYTAWGNPQVDETSCYPWGIRFIHGVTGEIPFLQEHYDEVYEAAIASSQDSTFDSRLRFEDAASLMYSMSIWEDAFDVFNYSNASVVRGLEDAAAIADILNNTACPGGPNMCGYHTDRDLFTSRAATIRAALDARLAWDGENTDISQAGIVYPMNVYPAGHARAEHIFDRFNGVATDAFGNNHPLMNFPGGARPEWEGLVNRYWGDSYWNGGPWFLSTLWYGAYYAQRNTITAGKADIDNFKYRLDRCIDFLGGVGLGAEQIASNATQVYPGFHLQTAYPNAWESMSFLVDSIMLFLDWTPDAGGNILRIRPKLPSAWGFLGYDNLLMGPHRVDVRVDETIDGVYHTFTNQTGLALGFDTVVRLPGGAPKCHVALNGVPAGHSFNEAIGAVGVQGALATGSGATTTVVVLTRHPADVNRNGVVDFGDVTAILSAWGGAVPRPFAGADATGDSAVTFADITTALSAWGQSCP